MVTGLYQKVAGAWVPSLRPYVKQDDVWVGAKSAYTRTAGIWTKFWEYDVTPSSPPQTRLRRYGRTHNLLNSEDQINSQQANYIGVGVRLPDGVHDTDLKMIRVLSTYAGQPPSSQYGGTYTETPDNSVPQEPWSDYYYNGWGPGLTEPSQSTSHYTSGRSTMNYIEKPWPRNATSTTVLGRGTYYFTAWSLDNDNNWSEPTYSSIVLPAYQSSDPYTTTRNQYFYPTQTGSYVTGAYTSGVMTQNNTDSKGILTYGNQVTSAISAPGNSELTVNTAQIQVYRTNDSGDATAKIWAGWNSYTDSTALPVSGQPVANGITLLGTISKGEAKWFSLPPSWNSAYDANFKGITFWNKDPNVVSPTSADYSVLESRAVQIKTGMLQLIWTVS